MKISELWEHGYMGINADKPQLWKNDIAKSVDLFNRWFLDFAPKAYRHTRVKTTENVLQCFQLTDNLKQLDCETLINHPELLPTLRMSTCPPIARDRLIGLSGIKGNLVNVMESGKLPARMDRKLLNEKTKKVLSVIEDLLDYDILPWLSKNITPPEDEKYRAATVIADRLCGSISNPIIRNAQEKRQLLVIKGFLEERGYKHKQHPTKIPIDGMEKGTFSFRTNVTVGTTQSVNIPLDVIIQKKKGTAKNLPIFIEAKSAGDFANVNKRRKEEAHKINQLRKKYGLDVRFVLFLCGYFDAGYLGYEAAEGIDWIWEHRIEDMEELGL